jgi:SPP1 gp7 family putative phage head morphogenesis protein
VASPLTFQEALDYAKSRAVVLPEEYYGQLVGVQRQQATTVAGLATLEQIKFIIDLVSAALKDGMTFAQFQELVAGGEQEIGLPKHRLDNIFRTNLQTSYNRGRWEQQQRVAGSRPWLMYDAINDSRTRPNHTAMDNTILHRDDPWWNTHYPPCGYRCRCTVISLTEKQAQARGVSASGPDVDPDEGWDFNPGTSYGEGVKGALDSFGADLLADHPKLTSNVEKMKSKIRAQAEEQGANRNL